MSLRREEIIRMALEFGWSYYDEYKFDIDELQEFVNAICAAEREQCAKICDEKHDSWRWDDRPDSYSGPRDCASAIRARGNGGEK